MPRHVVVDPSFGATLRQLRTTRGLSLRELGRLASYSHTQVWELETGRQTPSPDAAARLDSALGAGTELASMVVEDRAPLTPDDDERLNRAAAHPRRVDAATIGSFATILAHQRRLEDNVGSAALLAPVVGQLTVMENLVVEARGPLRPAVVDVAGQWAQFNAWLHAHTGAHTAAARWYARALEWATEAGDTDLVATVLSMRGHLAWTRGEVGPMIGLSQAAARQPASAGVRAMAVQQEARGHALAGDADAVARRLDEALDLAVRAAADPDGLPPWIYFYGPDMLMLQRGLAYHYLGQHERAAELLGAALDALPPEIRHSEWIAWYVLRRALSLAQVGDDAGAARAVGEAHAVAVATGSVRLGRWVGAATRRLGL